MRLFNHFEFRKRVTVKPGRPRDPSSPGDGRPLRTRAKYDGSGEPTTRGLQHLSPVPGWALEHYHPGWRRTKERLLFR